MSSAAPLARSHHAAVYDAAGGRLFVFGGLAEKRRLGDVHFLDMHAWAWHRCKAEGTGATGCLQFPLWRIKAYTIANVDKAADVRPRVCTLKNRVGMRLSWVFLLDCGRADAGH